MANECYGYRYFKVLMLLSSCSALRDAEFESETLDTCSIQKMVEGSKYPNSVSFLANPFPKPEAFKAA